MNGCKKMIKRISAMFLAALLMVSSVDFGILNAEAAEKTEVTCPNHPAHTADCGYVEAVEGSACTHEHTDECYRTVTECVHEHGEECYEKKLTCENTGEGHEHTDECYTEILNCAHECSEESGCIREELDCKHVHDESCGYVEAVEGHPCTHSCELCSGQEKENTDSDQVDKEGQEELPEKLKALQDRIDDLPTVEEFEVMTGEKAEGMNLTKAQYEIYMEADVLYEEYDALSEEEKAQLDIQKLEALMKYFQSAVEVYGEEASTTHEHDDKVFIPWPEDNKLTNGNHYYLTCDVKLTQELQISGGEVSVCLNGHTLNLNGYGIYLYNNATLNIYDCGSTGKITGGSGHYNKNYKGGAVYVQGSTLNIYGGSIEGNHADWGGAIFIDASTGMSTVNMYGGVIQNNTATSGGGGIEVENSGSVFNMYGGSIIDNKVTSLNSNVHKGGGVHFADGTMTIAGTVQISGNQVAGKENNVYLRSGKTITSKSVGEGSWIGVSAYDTECSGYNTKIGSMSSTDANHFFMDGTHDKNQYALIHNGTELQIVKHQHNWKYVSGAGDNADTLYAYCTNSNPKCGYHENDGTGLPLTITAKNTSYSGRAYNGAELSAEKLTLFNELTGNKLSNTNIEYYTDENLSTQTNAENAGSAGNGRAPVKCGTYYAAVKVNNAVAKVKFTIEKTTVTITAPTGLTKKFDNTAQELITAGNVKDSSTFEIAGRMEYQVAENKEALQENGWSESIPTAKEMGIYRIYYRAVADEYHVSVDYADGYPYVEAEITKGAPVYTAPQAVGSLTYNGKAQKLIAAGTTEHGTISYSLNGTDWTTKISEITGTDADEYTVYWKLEGDASHADVSQQTIKVTIQKAEPSEGTIKECIIMSGNQLSSFAGFEGFTMRGVDGKELPGIFEWKDGTTIPSASGTQTAVFKPQETSNYKEVSVSVPVKIYYLPIAKITVKDSSWSELLKTITFGTYHATEQVVTIEGTVNANGGYDIDRIYYYIDTTGSTAVLSSGELESKWQEYHSNQKSKVEKESKNVIYAKVTDKGGNATIVCSNGIIIDGQAPIASVKVNDKTYTASDSFVIKGSAALSIAIVDQGDSGLKSATAGYEKAGDTATTNISLTNGIGTATITTPGEYILTISAEDHAGNIMSVQEYHFTVVEAHTITLTNASARNAVTGQKDTRYVKDDKVIITADEPEAEYVFDYWEISGMELDDTQKKSSEITIIMPDHDVVIKAVYRDNTAPVISGIEDGGKYCKSITVTVTDKNLENVTLDGSTVTLNADSSFTINADDRSHTITAKDKAGNETKYTVTVYTGHDFAHSTWREIGRKDNVITEEAFCEHGCGAKITRDRTTEGDVIRQETPGDNDGGFKGSLTAKVDAQTGTSETPKTRVSGLNVDVVKELLSNDISEENSGKELLVYLAVEKRDEENIPANDQSETKKKASEKKLQQGIYLDLSMWKKIGDEDPVPLGSTQISKELKITITLPEDLKAPAGKVRTYYVIRVHDGIADVLETECNGSEISFKTDRFSTYSVWYTEKDAPAPSGSGDNTTGGSGNQGASGSQDNSNNPDNTTNSGSADRTDHSDSSNHLNSSNSGNTNAPKTGDESNVALWSILLLLAAVVFSEITAKRKNNRA